MLDIMIPAESSLTVHNLSALNFSSSGKSKVSASSSQIDCFLCEGQSTCSESREAMTTMYAIK